MEWKKWRLLGSGSYGNVHLAGPVNNSDSVVAVKSGNTEKSIYSLKAEANLLQELGGCPYIIQGFGDDVSLEDGSMVYNLLLEYACLGSLDELIEDYKSSMPESLVACYTYMLVKGLTILHGKDIIHCDFKPANVLVFPLPGWSGIHLLKIADFGLSKKEGGWDRGRRGTPRYVSPETVTSCLQEKPSDIWSLGCTVVEMITGRPMWSTNGDDLMLEIVHGSPRIPENISGDAKDFLERCLNKDHNQRWTAQMLLDHPFIARFGIYLRNEEKVLPKKPWICSKDKFTTTLKAGKKLQGCGKPFFVPHELFQMTRNQAAAMVKQN